MPHGGRLDEAVRVYEDDDIVLRTLYPFCHAVALSAVHLEVDDLDAAHGISYFVCDRVHFLQCSVRRAVVYHNDLYLFKRVIHLGETPNSLGYVSLLVLRGTAARSGRLIPKVDVHRLVNV